MINMKKRQISLLLGSIMLLSLFAQALAAPAPLPVDDSQRYSFILSNPEQGSDIKVLSNEEFVIEFSLIREDISVEETYTITAMQNEIVYDTGMLELVSAESVETYGDTAPRIYYIEPNKDTLRKVLVNSGNRDRHECRQEFMAARLTFRALGEGITEIVNENVKMSNPTGTGLFASSVTNARVTIGTPELASYEIALIQPTGGTIATIPANTAQAGSEVSLSITLSGGYSLGSWIVTAEDGKNIDVTGAGLVSGASFVMPEQQVTVTARLNPPPAPPSSGDEPPLISIGDDETPMAAPDFPRFDDVGAEHWAYIYVEYMAKLGFVNGKTTNLFFPGDSITRGEFVTILARMSGESLPEYADEFEDVYTSDFFARAVAWADKNGVTLGTSETTFSPNEKIKRQDIAVMLVRYSNYRGFHFAQTQEPFTFIDGAEISDYAAEAVRTIQQANIINGYEDGSFQPAGNATRAESSKLLALIHYAMFPELLIEGI